MYHTRLQYPVLIEDLEGRRMFDCSEFGQAVAAAARGDEPGPPPAEVVAPDPTAGADFGAAVSEAASACAQNE
jgi:hypothetical protein